MAADPGTRVAATGIARWQMPSLIVGVIGLAASLGMAMVSEAWKVDFFRAWLTSYLYWFSIAAGSLAVLMLQYVTGGEWGLMVRRPLGAAARTLWLMLLLFIPIVLGMKQIYPWMNTEFMQGEELMRAKLPWLNFTRFLIFVGIYFALWLTWA